jgi:hypothetical protein
MKKFNVADGLTTEQVAQRLGVKPRTVHHHVQTGNLRPVKYLRPGIEGGKVNLFDPAEIDAFIQQRVDAKTALVPANGPGPLVPVVRNAPLSVVRVPEQLAARPLTASDLKDKRYLTIEEAIAYTGLGEFFITAKVKTHPIGPRASLVYKRSDLDKL